ncbi:MAG: M48 family metalloprotease, partial [Terriglobales bacterium]
MTLALLSAALLPALAQAPPQSPSGACAPLPAFVPARGEGILSPQQSVWVYQLMLAQAGGSWDPIADSDLNRELAQVTARLTAGLPASAGAVHVQLVPGTFANAVTLPAGHVLVMRPLVSLMHNEDELAGVIAHELGHVYTRDDDRNFAAMLHDDLGVSEFGESETAFTATFQRWLTWRERHPSKVHAHDDEAQLGADSVAVSLMRRAGYDPRGLPDGFDRLAGTHGDTGNWLSNLLGSTSPDAKRLRAMIADSSAAAGCAHAPAAPVLGDADFRQWQDRLIAWTPAPGTPSLPGLLSSQKLDPLEDNFRILKFSPDGHYIVAMNASGVWVLTTKPLAVALHLDDPQAMAALFSPDSSAIVLNTSDGRVERWEIAAHRRTLLRQVVPANPGCAVAAASPDAAWLACARRDGTFQLLDVASGTVRFEHGHLPSPAGTEFYMTASDFAALSSRYTRLDFSPDARYLAIEAGHEGYIVDLARGRELALPGGTGSFVNRHFSFLSAHEALASDDPQGIDWRKLEFPSGKTEAKYRLGNTDIVPETQGPYVITRPMGKSVAGVVNPVTHAGVLSSGSNALDGYGDDFVGEGSNGDIYLDHNDGAKLQPLAHLRLPTARLADVSQGEASPDLRLLALSEPQRGAVWDLLAKKQLSPVHGFQQAWMEGAKLWFQFNPEPSQTAMWTPYGVTGTVQEFDLIGGSKRELAAPPRGEFDRLQGPLTLVLNPGGKPARDALAIEMRDTATGKALWQRQFRGDVPALTMMPAGRMLLLYGLDTSSARKAAAADPAWRAAAEAVADRKSATWVEILNGQTGALEHATLLDPAPTLDLGHC